MSYIGLSGYNSAHWPPGLSKLSISTQFRPRRPASKTVNNPTGPAPITMISFFFHYLTFIPGLAPSSGDIK